MTANVGSTVSGPTVIRRQLGRRLEQAMTIAKIPQVDLLAETGFSRTKWWRIVSGEVSVSRPDIRELIRIFGVSPEDASKLETLANATTGRGWWADFGDAAPDWFELYVGLEEVAARIDTWEDMVVPGEFQTPAYARAVFRAAQPEWEDHKIEQAVKLRLVRQEGLFEREEAPELRLVIGEGVLRRKVGSAEVLAEQIEHLLTLNQRDNITILYVPFDAGAHAGMTGAFRTLSFDDPLDPDVVYLETQTGAKYLEEPDELTEYRRVFDLIRKSAKPIEEYQR